AHLAQSRSSRGQNRRGDRRPGSPGVATSRGGDSRARTSDRQDPPRARAAVGAAVTIHALDIGTSSARAQQFDGRGEAAGELRQEEYDTDDPAEVARAVRGVLRNEKPEAIACFAHSLLAVDREWNPLTAILGWRDTRSADAAEHLARKLDAEAVHARTRALLHPSL